MSDSEEYNSDHSDNESVTDEIVTKPKKTIVAKSDLPDLNSKYESDDEEENVEEEDEDDFDDDELDDVDEAELYKDDKRASSKKNVSQDRGGDTEMVTDDDEPEAFHLGMASDTEDEEDDDDEDPSGSNYLEKFDESTKQNIIDDFHPELYQHNYDEIEAMTKIVRQHGTIVDPLHRTLPFLTKYEKTRILGERTKQLNAGAKPFVEVKEHILDGYLIALQELEEKKIPYIVKRPLRNGGCEYWKLKDLEILA
jgi:DNA-directed RNA polymerase I, II, and III subunit RPABC2